MKKVIGSLFIVLFIAVYVAGALTMLETKKQEQQQVKKYIKMLDEKIVAARAAKQINKISSLKTLKTRQLDRAKKLNAEIIALEKASPQAPAEAKTAAKVEKPAGADKKGPFQLEVVFGGGAGIIGGGYTFKAANLDLTANAGYGLGNKYNVLIFGVKSLFPFSGGNFAGVELNIVNYSAKVTDIPGVSGTIDKGSRLGFGVLIGRPVGPVNAYAGYNTALGLTAGAIYKF